MIAMVIDDEILAVEYISRLLKKAECTVHCYTNPFEALASKELKIADAFYLDIKMPGISGLELTEKIHAVNENCEVVFITGHNQYALDAFGVNAIDYLLKPVTQKQVDRSVERIQKRRGIKVPLVVDKIPTRQQVKISLFGKTSVITEDGSKNLRFITLKVTEVFCFMLLQNAGTKISKWKLIDEIWPDKDPDKSDINMRSTISRLNKTFRENDIPISMISTINGYQLAIETKIEVDAFQLKSLCDEDYIITKDNLFTSENIITKYNDLFLEDFEGKWCDTYRALYRRYFKIATHKLITYYKNSHQDPLRILNIVERILGFEPYDDELRELALILYDQGYGKSEAIKYYREYTRILKEDLEIQPGEKLRNCYQRLVNR